MQKIVGEPNRKGNRELFHRNKTFIKLQEQLKTF